MPIPTAITDLSTDPASNSPTGNENPIEGDNHLRTAYAFIRQLYNGKSANFVSVKDYGAVGDGVTNDTTVIQTAIDAVGDSGGGIVFFPPGSYSVTNSGPGTVGGASGATSWDNRYCMQVRDDDVYIWLAKGAILTLANSGDAHVIKFGQREGTTISVSGGGVFGGGEIDGNRSNQTTPTASDNHWDCINVASGCTRITIDDLYLHDAQYYGVGFQRDNFKDCCVSRLVIEDTGADAIDCKDDNGTSSGNTLHDIKARRFGLVGALTLQSGIGIRSGWIGTNLRVREFSGDRHGIRLERGSVTEGSEIPQISDFHVEPSAADTTVGVFVGSTPTCDEAIISAGRVVGCSIGVDSRGSHTQIDSVRAKSCTTGIQVFQHSQVDNCAVRSCGTGLNVRGPTNTITNLHARNNTLGANVEAGSNATTHFRGGVFGSNTTNFTDSGTDTAVSHIAGIRTHSVGTADFAIDSTGEKSLTIAHNLDFTPNINDVVLSYKRNTNVTDHRIGYGYVTGVDATNVTVRVMVSTASATGGALMTAVVNCMAKKASRQ